LLAPLHHDIADSPTDGRAYWAKTSDGIRIRFAIWDGSQNYVLIFPGRTEWNWGQSFICCHIPWVD